MTMNTATLNDGKPNPEPLARAPALVAAPRRDGSVKYGRDTEAAPGKQHASPDATGGAL